MRTAPGTIILLNREVLNAVWTFLFTSDTAILITAVIGILFGVTIGARTVTGKCLAMTLLNSLMARCQRLWSACCCLACTTQSSLGLKVRKNAGPKSHHFNHNRGTRPGCKRHIQFENCREGQLELSGCVSISIEMSRNYLKQRRRGSL